MSWLRIQEAHYLHYTTTGWLSTGLWHLRTSGSHTTTMDDWLWQSIFYSQACSRQGRGHSLVACCQSLPEATSLHVRSVLNRGDAPKSVPPAAGLSQPHGQFSSTRKPERMSHVEPFKSSMNPNVVSPATFTRVHQPSTISSSILTTFCREHTSTASGLQNRLSESSWKPKAGICMLFG